MLPLLLLLTIGATAIFIPFGLLHSSHSWFFSSWCSLGVNGTNLTYQLLEMLPLLLLLPLSVFTTHYLYYQAWWFKCSCYLVLYYYSWLYWFPYLRGEVDKEQMLVMRILNLLLHGLV
jgi:hypothetical protein